MAVPVASPSAEAGPIGSEFGTRMSLMVGGAIATLFVLNYLMTPKLDPREPPLLQPTIPWIGHIINIIIHQAQFHTDLKAKHPMPIASLQMLWGKIYAIWDPFLAQAVLKSRACSFDEFSKDFAGRIFDLTSKSSRQVHETKVLDDFNEGIHAGLRPVHIQELSVVACGYISGRLNEVASNGLEIPNLFLWVREVITIASTRALFGRENPFDKDPSLIEDLAIFDRSISSILTWPFPRITCARGIRAREKLRAGLMGLYGPAYDASDPSVSAVCRNRAAALRKYDWPVIDIAGSETMLAGAATINTVPTMFWVLYHVLPRRDLIQRLRRELEPRLTRSDDGFVTVDVNSLNKTCPLLLSVYRETVRVANQLVSFRRVMEDTIISDGHGGSYVLKKGTDLQIAGSVLRGFQDIWGPDPTVFDPDRFTPERESAQTSDESKVRKAAYFPFGGGKHLCPGRNFAYLEILATTCMVVSGFDVEPLDGEFAVVKAETPKFSAVVEKPVNNGAGYGVKISPRKGWENLGWRCEFR